ncbi:hypothetical protein [Niabella hibiscisoli]|uniref:hypothetical protein n=1 Tax=Niabella hibiscisoli TaxID=1825928 RepID=UPI001F1173D0|nr:hypothetical protein [Niabella hibiscisoli]MCH5718781.1 hypothetical protein [Niabella hibiscisoli]
MILIGSNHFNSSGFDRSKLADIDLIAPSRQRELEEQTTAISKKYHPDNLIMYANV